jgi:two-component system LytT family response regulator
MKLRAAIVDDEPIARRRLRRFLELDPDCEVSAEYGDGQSAIAGIGLERPDLVFLDVQMPEIDGFAVAERVGLERMPVTIFVTAHDDYALRAFDAHALDYLLKPFAKERFNEALARAKQHIAGALNSQALRGALAMIKSPGAAGRYLDQLAVTQQGRIVFLPTSAIDWIEVAGNYSRLHANGRELDLRESLTALCEKLDPLKFIRIHRSTVVNIQRIKEIQPWFGGHHLVILNDGTELRLSRYQKEAAKQLGL